LLKGRTQTPIPSERLPLSIPTLQLTNFKPYTLNKVAEKLYQKQRNRLCLFGSNVLLHSFIYTFTVASKFMFLTYCQKNPKTKNSHLEPFGSQYPRNPKPTLRPIHYP